MFAVIFNSGDYQEVNAKTVEQAVQWCNLRYTQKDLDGEAELVNSANETVYKWEEEE